MAGPASLDCCGVDGDLYSHVALLGEFDGIAEQICQDLTDTNGIADNSGRSRQLIFHQQLKTFPLGSLGQLFRSVFDQVSEVDRGRMDFQFAGLDL